MREVDGRHVGDYLVHPLGKIKDFAFAGVYILNEAGTWSFLTTGVLFEDGPRTLQETSFRPQTRFAVIQ